MLSLRSPSLLLIQRHWTGPFRSSWYFRFRGMPRTNGVYFATKSLARFLYLTLMFSFVLSAGLQLPKSELRVIQTQICCETAFCKGKMSKFGGLCLAFHEIISNSQHLSRFSLHTSPSVSFSLIPRCLGYLFTSTPHGHGLPLFAADGK